MRRKWKKRIASCLLGCMLLGALGGVTGYWLYLRKPKKTQQTNFPHVLKDKNELHLSAAKKYGVRPIKDREEAKKQIRKLFLIGNCDEYCVDNLTYSVPYLTAEAKTLLKTIGSEFQKELKQQGFRPHRLIVTSVLRTEEDVKRLRKKNINAVTNSPHCYATTFDITYIRFDRLSKEGKPIGNKHLASILCDVLARLRRSGHCYVVQEVRQPCFHITSRR